MVDQKVIVFDVRLYRIGKQRFNVTKQPITIGLNVTHWKRKGRLVHRKSNINGF